jgi:hypothetical protein
VPVWLRLLPALLLLLVVAAPSWGQSDAARRGPVRVKGYSLVDDNGPFLGLGASYFTALHRCRHDRDRLERDLEFLSAQGFNYYRMLSMVGWHPAWEGSEIAPIDFANREGKQVPGWPDYWQQFGELIDIAYDRYGLRTQVTLFADAQLMPDRGARLEHIERFLKEVLRGREQKVMLVEVANEAWQNGFEGDQGVADLRELARLLNERTDVPVAITSNHHDSFEGLYQGSKVDLATWHFSRDRRSLAGWRPVVDCWDYALRPGCPPVVSNEPIGPGSSVNAERDEVRLAMAAAFAYTAKLPGYVFHSEAGVFGNTLFAETPGVRSYHKLIPLLPADLASWTRNDGIEPEAPFTLFANDQRDTYLDHLPPGATGCIRSIGARKESRFVALPIGIAEQGLRLEARHDMAFRVHHPVTGELLSEYRLAKGEQLSLPRGAGAVVILGEQTADLPAD